MPQSFLALQLDEIVREVSDPNGTVNTVIGTLWTMLADKALVRPDLQGLYVKRACLDIRLAEEQSDVDYDVGKDISAKDGQVFLHLQQMRADCQDEIIRVEALARAQRVPVTGTLHAVTPEVPPRSGTPDANSVGYRGDPYIPLRRTI